MSNLPGSDIPHRVVNFIRGARRPRTRQTNFPRNLGIAPGTLRVSPDELPPKMSVIAFSADRCEERELHSVSELDALQPGWTVLWVNVEGLGDPAVLNALAARFALHPLAMEDVADTTQRAKVEPYGATTFIVLPLPHSDEKGFWTEQHSMFITEKCIITFQSAHAGDCLGELRDRIRSARGRVRTAAAPYLAYAIADAIIDGYFPIVNRIGDTLETLEEVVLTNPNASQLMLIRRTRSELIRLRRAVYPMRDAVNALGALDRVFDAETRPYLRDLSDHISRLLDQLDTDRYMASDLLEIYMTCVNLKLGETTKVLTIIATIFIPLGFIAGVYGMNFDFMPELHWRYGYGFALAIMFLTTVAFLVYFWRKGWLRDTTVPRLDDDGAPDLPGGEPEPLHPPHPPR